MTLPVPWHPNIASFVVQLALGTFSLTRCLPTSMLTACWPQMPLSVDAFVHITPLVCFLHSFPKSGQENRKGKKSPLRVTFVLFLNTGNKNVLHTQDRRYPSSRLFEMGWTFWKRQHHEGETPRTLTTGQIPRCFDKFSVTYSLWNVIQCFKRGGRDVVAIKCYELTLLCTYAVT